jgi:hypothetical protein
LWCRQSGHDPGKKIAKFGYVETRYESEKKKEGSFYIIGYLLKVIIKIWRIEKKQEP